MEHAAGLDPRLDRWIAELAARGGSDLLLMAGSGPFGRIDGELTVIDPDVVLDAHDTVALLESIVGAERAAEVTGGGELDFSFSWNDQARVRGNAFVQRGELSLSLRRIPMQIPTIADIGLPAAVVHALQQPSGLILVTGPTGSGKSTTLAAMIGEINATRGCHIVTIEDPVEYLHANQRSAVSQREIGSDTGSFAHALKAVLREDPDVVLVGEIRDPESIAAALTIAETGHLVFATLHTNDSGQAVDRIVDVFPSDARPQVQVQLSATLLAVVYQRLVPKVGGGMVAAYEVMTGANAVRNLVREGKTRQLRNVVATNRGEGMQTLETHLSALVAAGTITHERAVAASLYPQEITRPQAMAGAR